MPTAAVCEVAKHERTPTTADGVRKAALLLFPPFERAQLEGSGADAVTGSRTQSIMAKDKKKAKKRKAEAAAAAAAQSSSDAASAAEETVDDIFAALKKEKRPPKAEKPTTKKPRRDAEAERKEDDRWRAGRPPTPPGRQENPQVHRYAADGLPVYKYFHLGMDQQDGGTPLCPFDCDCCF